MRDPDIGFDIDSVVVQSRHKNRTESPGNKHRTIPIERQAGPPPPVGQRSLHSCRTGRDALDDSPSPDMSPQPPIDRQAIRANSSRVVLHGNTRSLVRRPNRDDERRKTGGSNSFPHRSQHNGRQPPPLIRRMHRDLQATSGVRSNPVKSILGSPHGHLVPATRRKRRTTAERHHDPPRNRHPTVKKRHHQMRPSPGHPPPAHQQAREAPLHEPRRSRRVRNRIHRLEEVRPLRQRHDLHG